MKLSEIILFVLLVPSNIGFSQEETKKVARRRVKSKNGKGHGGGYYRRWGEPTDWGEPHGYEGDCILSACLRDSSEGSKGLNWGGFWTPPYGLGYDPYNFGQVTMTFFQHPSQWWDNIMSETKAIFEWNIKGLDPDADLIDGNEYYLGLFDVLSCEDISDVSSRGDIIELSVFQTSGWKETSRGVSMGVKHAFDNNETCYENVGYTAAVFQVIEDNDNLVVDLFACGALKMGDQGCHPDDNHKHGKSGKSAKAKGLKFSSEYSWGEKYAKSAKSTKKDYGDYWKDDGMGDHWKGNGMGDHWKGNGMGNHWSSGGNMDNHGYSWREKYAKSAKSVKKEYGDKWKNNYRGGHWSSGGNTGNTVDNKYHWTEKYVKKKENGYYSGNRIPHNMDRWSP